MKIYTNYPNGVTKIIKEKEFYQTEDLFNEITVYVDNTNLSEVTYSLTLEFLRADGRKTSLTPVPPVVGESTTLTEDDVTYDIHKFVLTETQLAVAGALAFTCYITIVDNNTINSRGVLFNAISNVRKTVTYSTNTVFVVDDDDDVPIIIADMKEAITNLSGQLAGKVNIADIVDDLTHNDSNKPLSAKQGKVLKEALDLLTATTYTKSESDNTFAPKSNAIKHDGNQLKDYNDNNIYPKIADKYSLLSNNSNIDNIFDESSYFLFYAYTYSGTFPIPLNTNFGFLTTNKLNAKVSVQWYYYPNGNGLYYRASDNGNWISWKKINTMADNSITTSMLQNLSITTPKLENNSVTGNKIATRFNYLMDILTYADLNANTQAKIDQNILQASFYSNYFKFKGATTDNYIQTKDITVDTTKTYIVEVYCNSTNFTLYLVDNGSYIQSSRHNRGYAKLEFTPTTSIIAIRFDVDVADTYGEFYGFKLYEKSSYRGEVEATNKYDYVGNNRINFTIDLDGVDIPCYIYLPATYSKYGKPSECIMICHGSGQVIGDNSTENINIVNALVNAGFAVFDCNGNTSNTAQAWGCPKNQEAYLKAYEYVQNHFNVKKQINVYGLSMGGLSAMNFVTWFPSLVKAVGLGAPCIDLYNEGWEFDSGRKSLISTAYGMSGTTTYEIEKTYGCDPSQRIVEIDGTKYLFNLPPIKLWHGTIDTVMPYEYSVNFIQYANNGGNYALIHLIEGAGHEVCYGGNATVVTEIVNWFKQFANND